MTGTLNDFFAIDVGRSGSVPSWKSLYEMDRDTWVGEKEADSDDSDKEVDPDELSEVDENAGSDSEVETEEQRARHGDRANLE